MRERLTLTGVAAVITGCGSENTAGQQAAPPAADRLRELSVRFPHYFGRDASIGRVFRGGRAGPTTAFCDVSGELAFTHRGACAGEAKLVEEIGRYALRG